MIGQETSLRVRFGQTQTFRKFLSESSGNREKLPTLFFFCSLAIARCPAEYPYTASSKQQEYDSTYQSLRSKHLDQLTPPVSLSSRPASDFTLNLGGIGCLETAAHSGKCVCEATYFSIEPCWRDSSRERQQGFSVLCEREVIRI